MMRELLPGRRAIVTGGARGIGLAIAECFLEQGASVAIADVDGPAVDEAAARLRELYGDTRVVGVQLDVTDPLGMGRIVDHTVELWGALDVMVNNAGITRDATIRTMTLEDWQLVLQVHLTGTFLGIKEAARV